MLRAPVTGNVRQHVTRRFAFLVLALLSFGGVAQTNEPSLLQLLTDPARYDGRNVVVLGYCRLQFESLAIHLTKEDYTYSLGNMVWLDLSSLEEITPERRKIGHCLVQGTYNAKNRGHLGMFVGAIENIKRYEPWPPPPPRRSKGATR
jgi:hypothetical protein